MIIQLKNIPKEFRVCNKCGEELHGRGFDYFENPEKGKFLCHKCGDAHSGSFEYQRRKTSHENA